MRQNKIDKDKIKYLEAKKRAERVSYQLSMLMMFAKQIEYGNQKGLDDLPFDDVFRNLVEQTAQEADDSSIPLIDIILGNLDKIKEYLLNRKEELQKDG